MMGRVVDFKVPAKAVVEVEVKVAEAVQVEAVRLM